MTLDQIFQLAWLALPIVVALAIPLAKLLIAKLPQSQQANALQHVQIAVQAVEQMASANTSTLDSAGKKALALDFAQQLLKSAHIPIPMPILDTLIEAAVFLLNQSKPIVLEASQNAKIAPQTSASPVGSTPASTSSIVSPTSA